MMMTVILTDPQEFTGVPDIIGQALILTIIPEAEATLYNTINHIIFQRPPQEW